MRFDPNKADGFAWESGLYDFVVKNAQDKVSKAGNDMIEVVLEVYNTKGDTQLIYDYLLAGQGQWKLKHFCETSNLMHKFETGNVCGDDFIGASGSVWLIIDEFEGKKSNKVKDYFGKTMQEKNPKKQENKIGRDPADDTPF